MTKPAGEAPERVSRRKSQVTKERIAVVALELFNRLGYTPVTTNRIAQACGISPGNLYYHFRNREDILWFLFEGVENQVRALFQPPAADDKGLGLIQRQIEAVLAILLEYRFFFPDQTAILRRDDRVMAAFRGMQTDLIAAISVELEAAMAGSPVPPPDAQAMARGLWLTMTGWVTFLLAEGRRIDRDSVAEVLEVALAPIRPFVSAAH